MLSVEGHEGNHFQDLGGDSPCMMLWLSPSSFGSHISTPPFLDCRLLSTHKANTPLTGLRGLNELTCGWGLTLLHTKWVNSHWFICNSEVENELQRA